MFTKTIEALKRYEEMRKHIPESYDEEYALETYALDISKAFVWDLGYKEAVKFANGILALNQLHLMR